MAVQAGILVTAVLAVLSCGAYLVARGVLYGRLHERLERAADSDQWQAQPGSYIVGSAVPAQEPDRDDEAGFEVARDARYGALAILRRQANEGGPGVLAMPARDDVEALRAFLLTLAGLTLAGGLVAVPAGYVLADRALRPLDRAVRERTEFVALASHRLRTPLSVIRTSTELALARQGLTATEALRAIGDQTLALEALAVRLTALARTEGPSGRPAARDDRADLAEVARQVIGASGPAAPRVQLRLAAKPAIVAAPAADVQDMLSCVLENALEFTPPGGTVTVRTGTAGRAGWMEVEDEGPGIDPADLPHVTKPFVQGRRVRGGSGLGLAIASALAERSRGRIHVSSGPARGTTVRLTLPLAIRASGLPSGPRRSGP